MNGILKVNDGKFLNNLSYINRIGIVTSGDVFSAYFDAFGFSWDVNYDVGDNWNTYDCDGTPFEPGVNVIVIPTELFTETLLHHYLEQGTLSSTPLYHPDRYVFEFVSNDRDGTIDEANSDVDFFFMRRNISPEDAMDVLELVLKGLLNESLDESNNTVYTIGWINEYVSTKLNGTKATELNLPYSVLGYIPWFSPYKSSKMGGEPEPDGGFNLILWLLCMSNPILNDMLAMAMAMTGGEIFAYLKQYCENVLMNVLTEVGDLLWTLIKTAILITIWAIYILVTCFLTLAIGILAAALVALALIFEAEMYYTINSVGIDFGVFSFNTGFDTYFEYSNFLDLEIPFLYVYFSLGEIKLIGLIIKFWPPKVNFMAENATINEASPETSMIEDFNLGSLKTSSLDDDPILNCVRAFIVGMDASFGLWSLTTVIISLSFLTPPQYEQIKWGIQIIAFSVNLASLIYDLLHYIDFIYRTEPLYKDYEAFWYLIGSGFVTILTGIKFFQAGKSKDLTFGDAISSSKCFISLFESFNKNSLKKEFWEDIIMALLPTIPAALKYFYYDERDLDWPEEAQNFFEMIFVGLELWSVLLSMNDWLESITFLECTSVLCSINTFSKGTFDRDIKQIGGLTIICGSIQILLAFIILLNI